MRVAILNCGGHIDYAYGLLSGLTKLKGLEVEIVDGIQSRGMLDRFSNVRFLPLRGNQDHASPLIQKLFRILAYYIRLLHYAATTESTLFHVHWENKFLHIDRTLLNVYYRLLGKKIVFTAHNVDSRARAGKRSVLNSTSLWLMYRIVDHVIVHTNKMKQELVSTFRVPDSKITVVPFGINICPPRTCVDSKQARNSLRVPLEKKVMLVFGSIDRYKGIEIAIESLSLLLRKDTSYYLVIAGRDKDCQDYVHELVNLIQERGVAGSVLMHNHFIPHEEVGKYFMAADCCVLSYKRIYQSGVPFLSFAFGLPVIATHVGSFREIIVDGVNGFICEPNSPDDLARKIERYFASDLLRNLPATRMAISRAAGEQYSWEKIGVATHAVYQSVAKLGK